MSRIRMKTIRELNEKDLLDRLQQLRSDLTRLQIDSSKGTLRKESGKIKPLKRDIARILTRLGEMNKKWLHLKTFFLMKWLGYAQKLPTRLIINSLD